MNNNSRIVINDNFVINKVENSNEFMGIKIEDNVINIFVPQVFRYDEKRFRKDLLLFLKSIFLVETIDKEFMNKGKVSLNNIWPFDSYLWIIRDFIENGYYYNREKSYSNKGGKIEWKKTLKNTPIYSGGNLIYDKIVTSKMSASNDIIAQIYRLCLKQSIEKVGWLFNANFKVEIQQLISKKEMIYKVKQAINNTFDDIKRMRFNHMLKILTETEGETIISNSYTYGIENYYYVYEKMVDSFFGGISDTSEKQKYNPSAKWNLLSHSDKKSSDLRPDTIVKKDGKTFVIDAKMYRYGHTHNPNHLPHTGSIQKQITYGDFIHKKLGDKYVRNVFVLPYDKSIESFVNDEYIEKQLNDNLVYIGEAYADWRVIEEKEDYDHVYTFLIDFNHLLNNYYLDDLKYIDKICEIVESKLTNNIIDAI